MAYFTNKVVVVTGAASGMGRSYAKEFAAQGAKLALMDFDGEGLAETAGMIGLTDEYLLTETFDVSSSKAMQAFAKKVLDKFGTVDVVINNAGIGGGGLPAWEMPAKSYEKVMAVNFYGVLHGTRAFLPSLIEKNSGHIVNVSSIFGLAGAPNNTDYCASKFAVRGYTEALMAELSDSRVGIHLVHPGGIATNIANADEFVKFRDQYLTTSPDAIAKVVRKALEKGVAKVVYGNDSFKTWIGSNFLPTRLMSKLVWADMKKTLDPAPYEKVGIKAGK